MINKLVVLLVAAGMSMTLCAMPTAEEQEKVRPLVQGLMKPDLDAMKLGKKSRSDVAKSAMDLYSKADSPAAKMLLARNALNLYAKAGEYEAAESALDALLAAVPDYPAVDIAELLEKTLHPIPNRAAPNLRARLAAVKDKAQAASQLKKLLPVYGTLAEGPKRKACAARIASAYVALDDWPNANKYFAVSDSPAAAAASAELKLQDEPEASRPYDKPADAWWLVELPKKDAKLSAAIRTHAAALYAKSLPSLKGLAKVQAERRIAEVESALAADQSAVPAAADNKKSAKSYVQNGLVAQWDGIENAGNGRHQSQRSEWVDLKGGKSFSLTKAASFSDNALVCDGTGYAGVMKGSIPSSKIVTAEIVFEIVATHGNSCLFSTGEHKSFYERCFGVVSSGSALLFADHVIGKVTRGRHSCHLSFSNGEFYINGIKGISAGKGTLDAMPARGEGFYIGGFRNSAIVCNIHSIRFYDRNLTDEEIKRNYQIDKERFGL